ncbi:hypothetical protein AAHC03_016430 [Spirometra sp. Aus1]
MAAIRQNPISCSGHTRPVVDLQFSGESECGALLVTASKDGKAMLRTGDTGDWIGTFLGHRGAVWCCTMDFSGQKAATGAADFSAKVWDVNTGDEVLSISQDHIVRAVDLSVSDGGKRLMTANNKQQVHIYDLAAPSSPIITLPGHKKTIRRCLWTDNDNRALTISDEKVINLWDLTPGASSEARMIWSVPLDDCPMDAATLTLPEGGNSVKAVVPLGKYVVVYDLDFRASSSSAAPELVAKFELPCPVYTAHMHPSGDMIVCGGEDNLIYRLDVNTGDILESCRGHFGPVHCVRFSPDGHLFASGSEDGTVRLWQTHVGENYGLWKLVEPTAAEPAVVQSSPPTVPASV